MEESRISNFKVRETEDFQIWSSCSRVPMVGKHAKREKSQTISYQKLISSIGCLLSRRITCNFFFIPHG